MRTRQQILIIVAGVVITTLVLQQFSNVVAHLLTVEYDWKFELAMVTGQVVFQFLFLLKQPWKKVLAYISKLLEVSLVGSVMLLPALGWNAIGPAPDFVNLGWFFSVVTVMFFLHRDYVEELDLPWYLCYTWVLYRLIILIFIT